MKRILLVLIFLLGSVCSGYGGHAPDQPKVIANKVKFKTYKNFPIYRREGSVIVKYKSPEARDAAKIKLTQAYVQKIKPIGERLNRIFFDEHVLSFSELKSQLLKNADVEAVEPDLFMNSLAERDWTPEQWPIQKIKKTLKKEKAREWIKLSAKSQRIRVGILDTGLDHTHPDLAENTFRGVNLIYDGQEMTPAKNSGEEVDDPTEMDYNGHGTMIAGVIGALHNDFGVDGLDPQPLMCGIKVFDQEGVGYLSDIIQGIHWAIENKIEVLNMSFGTYEYSQFLEEIITRAHQKGIILVGSAGNDYSNDTMYPSKFSEVIAVGSYDDGGWVSRFSNWGQNVDFYVPGSGLLTTKPLILDNDDPYGFFTGTSAAAAYMTGMVSLAMSAGSASTKIPAILENSIIHSWNEKNPTLAGYRFLNSPAILARINKEKFGELSLVKFFKNKRVIKKTEQTTLTYSIQNTGLQKTEPQKIYLNAESGRARNEVLIGKIPSLNGGERYEAQFTFIPRDLFSDDHLWDDLFSKINLKVNLELDHLKLQEEGLAVFVTDEKVTNAKIKSVWASPADFTGPINGRKIFVRAQNIGNQDLGRLRLNISWVAATHEGVALGEKTLLREDVKFSDLRIYESSVAEIDISDFVPPEGQVTFIAMLYQDDALLDTFYQGYKYPHQGHAEIQYATNVHRAVAYEAVELLRKQGIYIDDLMGPKAPIYWGNVNSWTEWPDLLTAPGNKWWVTDSDVFLTKFNGLSWELQMYLGMDTSGFWTDSVLNLGDAFFDMNGFSLIDGGTDCDGIDLVFNRTLGDTWDSHFWIVDDTDDHGNGGNDGVSAYRKIYKLLYGGNDLLHGAIEHYQRGYRKAAWWFLGHAVHLMGDLSLPSHVNDENIHGVVGAPYHDWMDEAYAGWDPNLALNRGGYLDPYAPVNEGNPIRFLAYTTAQMGNAWPWAHTRDFTDIGSAGNRHLGNNVSYANYMQNIFNALPSHPVEVRHINKNEVIDSCPDFCCIIPPFTCDPECQEVDWIGSDEELSDCWDNNRHMDQDNTDSGGSDADRDLSTIRTHSYTYAIRAAAGLIYYFAKETGQIGEDVVFSDRDITGTETIRASGNLTIQNVTVKAPNGDATFIAGEKIRGIPEVHVESGSKAYFKIDPGLK